MSERDLPPLEAASVPTTRRGRHPAVAVFAFVTGFLAVMLLGCGIIVWVAPQAKVDLTIGIDELGPWAVFTLHRFGLGAVLFGVGVWFTLITRGLWQGRRYGQVLGWITLAVALVIAILVAVT